MRCIAVLQAINNLKDASRLEVARWWPIAAPNLFLQMHTLTGPEHARATVEFWAAQGATSFKAYDHITRAELKAAIEAAHAKGLKITGHLCSVTYSEAAELGIDNLEHGFFVNTQLDPGKEPDVCPATSGGPTLKAMDPDGPAAKALIACWYPSMSPSQVRFLYLKKMET